MIAKNNQPRSLFDPLHLVKAYRLARDGLSNDEIAGSFGVAPATFEGWIRAKSELRELLETARMGAEKDPLDRFPGLTVSQRRFLAAYSYSGVIVQAMEATGIRAHYEWISEEGRREYREAFQEADREARERLLVEARRRAMEGVERVKFHNGQPILVPCARSDPKAMRIGNGDTVQYMKIYTEHHYSDQLLIKLLEALHKDFQQAKKFEVEHTGGIVSAIVDMTGRRARRSEVIGADMIERLAKGTGERIALENQ